MRIRLSAIRLSAIRLSVIRLSISMIRPLAHARKDPDSRGVPVTAKPSSNFFFAKAHLFFQF